MQKKNNQRVQTREVMTNAAAAAAAQGFGVLLKDSSTLLTEDRAGNTLGP